MTPLLYATLTVAFWEPAFWMLYQVVKPLLFLFSSGSRTFVPPCVAHIRGASLEVRGENVHDAGDILVAANELIEPLKPIMSPFRKYVLELLPGIVSFSGEPFWLPSELL